ncbi:MAG: ribonuclease III [Legionellales bacterium]|nr:ribonuclease III [Legionellales bacterium]
MHPHIKRLYQHLGYEFHHKPYLRQALTHCSVGEKNYERLEFLGDSILNLVISNALYHQYPQLSEGQLSRLRAFLVNGDMLADIALEIDLGEYLLLGQGELKSGGFRRRSILADALEAIFAAILLDSDFAHAQQVILFLYKDRLNDETLDANSKDAKTQLQEFLQAQKHPLPKYSVKKIIGEEHDQIFHIICHQTTLNLSTEGNGETRRKAEQVAAKLMLEQLKSA